jgi:hypothetical protein
MWYGGLPRGDPEKSARGECERLYLYQEGKGRSLIGSFANQIVGEFSLGTQTFCVDYKDCFNSVSPSMIHQSVRMHLLTLLLASNRPLMMPLPLSRLMGIETCSCVHSGRRKCMLMSMLLAGCATMMHHTCLVCMLTITESLENRSSGTSRLNCKRAHLR